MRSTRQATVYEVQLIDSTPDDTVCIYPNARVKEADLFR